MSSKVAVVIPTYKEELSPLEKISLEQCRKILGKYPLIFIAPEGKNFSYFAPNDGIAYFPPQFFQSVKTYSRLLMSPDFYETFADFEYILIYQLDAFVFYDALEDFCQLGWDYIGASWYFSWGDLYRGKTLRVGNGGFSLRKVAACHKLLLKKNLPNLNLLEDAFFAVCGASDELDFHVAPVKVADLFSMEHYPERNVRRLGYELPFGCHGWTKLSSDFYVNIFAQLGYDLRPFRAQMRSEDYEFFLPQSLVLLAMRRLIREINHGKKILQHLPTKNFSSVRVLRSPDTMKILSRLIWEENSLADKIFICDTMNDLIRDLERENLPHLLITSNYEMPMREALEKRGFFYGKHYISFQCEYLNRCEKLFHNLGKTL